MDGASERTNSLLSDLRHASKIVGGRVEADDLGTAGSPLRTADDVARWFNAYEDDMVALIESTIERGDPDEAASRLSQVWAVAPASLDLDQCRRLRDCGTRLATELPTSRVVARVLQHSAEALRQRGDLPAAELDGMRELAIWRNLDDPDGAIDALRRLSRTFLARERLHHVIDCADEMLTWSSRHQDRCEVPRALRNLGLIMVDAGRLDLASDYLTRAWDSLDSLPDVPASHRVELLTQLGRVHWMAGAESAARRRFSEALAEAVDVDTGLADRLRTLLATLSGAPLPESAMEDMDSV